MKNSLEHRPWQLPTRPWSYYQEWNNTIFLHWKVAIEELKKWVPDELEIDLINGHPWVSLVAFTMQKSRLRYLPQFPPISNFDEINIRTYVKLNNKAGVYFLSIEGGKKLSCKVAKRMSELPYRFSKMRRTPTTYESKNLSLGDHFNLNYTIGEPLVQKTALDNWLTERYALFQDTKTHINEFEIHHKEWEIKTIEMNNLDLSYPRFSKLINNTPNRAAYSKGVQVIAWDKLKNEKNISNRRFG